MRALARGARPERDQVLCAAARPRQPVRGICRSRRSPPRSHSAALPVLLHRIPAEAQQAGLAVLLVVVVLPVLVSQNPDLADTALLSNSKALAGLLGPLFFGAILYLLKAGGG
jgi:hypothetical protein